MNTGEVLCFVSQMDTLRAGCYFLQRLPVMPLRQVEAASTEGLPCRSVRPFRPGSGGVLTEMNQVLLVDDDKLIRAMVGEMVREAGFDPVIAASAQEAIGALATLQPLAVFVDFYMPDSFGDECCRIIKSNEELSPVPVVMMTSAAEEEVHRAFLAGADDFLPKPVRPYQLSTKLKAIREGLHRAPGPTRRDTPVKRILIADDDSFFRGLLGNLLERAGYEVVYAESALGALRTMLRGRPKLDACMLNAVLPGMDGIQLIRKLRAHSEFYKLPVFVISPSELKPAVLEQLNSLGIVHLIYKDAVNLEDLLKNVNALFFQVQEGRISKRVHFYRLCDFRCSGEADWLSGFIYNLSPGGVGVRTLTALSVGTVADIRFNFAPQLLCETKATVAWANEFNPRDASSFPYGMGLQFAETSELCQQWIISYVRTTLEA